MWLQSLGQRSFIGTESRLLTVFDLLNQIIEGSELNPRTRVAELQKKKAEINVETEQIRQRRIDLMEPTQVRERFLQMSVTARAAVGLSRRRPEFPRTRPHRARAGFHLGRQQGRNA